MSEIADSSSRPNSAAGHTVRTVRFRILRCDGPGKPPRWEEFDVPAPASANVISCLNWVAEHPITVAGVRTTPVVWECNCLEEVCGACTMVINGRVRQSCSCLIDNEAPDDGDVITLEPMRKFPVVRDLWVDRHRIFGDLERIRAWIPIDGTYDHGPGTKEEPDQQHERYRLSTCMSCGCCLDACPQYHKEEDPERWGRSFVGAAIISQAKLFNEHAIGKTLKPERLDVMAAIGGVNDCGNAQNCVKVCPKEIPLTESIAAIGRAVTIHSIGRFFRGG